MASVTQTLGAEGTGDAVVFSLAPPQPQPREQALALLLTGRARPGEPAVAEFLDFAQSQGLPLDQLWCATEHGKIVGSTLIVPSAGRTGMIFVWPITHKQTIPLATELVRRALAAQDASQMTLVQALLDPHQQFEQMSLSEAGFTPLAHLVYMHRRADLPPAAMQLPPGVTAVRWSEQNRGLFADAILASYEQTLDCPGLLGLRHIDDIIAGHMATGRFVPELWLALVHEGKPVGVLLLNSVPQRNAVEVVYLGIARAWRRRGIARQLMRSALGMTRQQGATTLILAVDDRNAPAVELYRSLGFHATARKLAMIYTLA